MAIGFCATTNISNVVATHNELSASSVKPKIKSSITTLFVATTKTASNQDLASRGLWSNGGRKTSGGWRT
jgi:hypothetical protein